jgi:hypothetical protein
MPELVFVFNQTPFMKLFLDTEFTDFIDIDLISIGIVSEDGREFYAERTDYDVSACSPFVRVAVLPQLNQGEVLQGGKAEIGKRLCEWLNEFSSIEICTDYFGDWELLLDLLDAQGSRLTTTIAYLNIAKHIDTRDVEMYWKQNGRRSHHALHDARANRYAYKQSLRS